MTLESLARTIAKARHGTDVMWPNYMEAAKKAAEWFAKHGREGTASKMEVVRSEPEPGGAPSWGIPS